MSTLTEKRTSALKENEAIALRVKAEGRPFTDAETRAVAENFSLAERLEATISTTNKIEESTRALAPSPSLLDGAARPEYRTLRTTDGREVRAFSRGQSMASAMPHMDGGLSLEAFGTALAATISGNRRGVESECRALSEGLNSGGGFFVTESLSAELLDLARNKSRVFEAGARVLDMTTQELRIVTIEEDPSFSLVAENGLIPSDDPVFNGRLLVARKHGVLVKCSNELMADGVGAGAAITNSIAAAWAVYLDGLVLTHLFGPAGVGQTDTVGAITYDDLLSAQYEVRKLNGEPTALLANSKTMNALSLLKESTTGAYLQPPSALADLRMLDTNAVADTQCILGDFTQAVVGTRGGLSIELSREAGDSFAYDQTWIRLLWRGDVNYMRKHFHVLDDLTY